jgi:hypothetical protein
LDCAGLGNNSDRFLMTLPYQSVVDKAHNKKSKSHLEEFNFAAD